VDVIAFIDIVSLVSTIIRYDMAKLIIRLRLTTVSMRPIFADGVAWSVCHAVGLSQS